jgi:hypothetical protein
LYPQSLYEGRLLAAISFLARNNPNASVWLFAVGQVGCLQFGKPMQNTADNHHSTSITH